MKDFLKKLIASKEARAKELKEAVKNSTNIDEVRSLGDTLEAVLIELADAKAQLEAVEAEAKSDDNTEGRSAVEARGINPVGILGFDMTASKEDNSNKEAEARATKFAETGRMTITNTEARAVLVASGQIATPAGVETEINDTFNKVSSIVDMVNVEDCEGMGEFKVPYVVTGLEAGKTVEGGTITDGDMTFAFASVKPHNVSVLAYISNQVMKQSPAKYEAKVRKAALDALRAKAAELIVVGDSDAGFEGIVNSDIVQNVPLTAIDEKTLRKIALNYGGDENVEQGAVLYLDKATLVAMGDVRGTSNKNAVYKITPSASNPNTGVIEDGGLVVPYCLNSKMAGKLVYGQPKNFTLGLFGNYEIKVSEDFAFNKNMLAIRGTVDLGGAVCFNEGFIVATVTA